MNLQQRKEQIQQIADEAKAKIDSLVDKATEVGESKGRWKPEGEQPYYYLDSMGYAQQCPNWNRDEVDLYRYENNNVFPDKHTANKYRDISTKLNEIASRNPVDWADTEQMKYQIGMNTAGNHLFQHCWKTSYLKGVYSTSRDFLKDAESEIGEVPLKWYLRYQAGLYKLSVYVYKREY